MQTRVLEDGKESHKYHPSHCSCCYGICTTQAILLSTVKTKTKMKKRWEKHPCNHKTQLPLKLKTREERKRDNNRQYEEQLFQCSTAAATQLTYW